MRTHNSTYYTTPCTLSSSPSLCVTEGGVPGASLSVVVAVLGGRAGGDWTEERWSVAMTHVYTLMR